MCLYSHQTLPSLSISTLAASIISLLSNQTDSWLLQSVLPVAAATVPSNRIWPSLPLLPTVLGAPLHPDA